MLAGGSQTPVMKLSRGEKTKKCSDVNLGTHTGGPREEETNPFLHSFPIKEALLSCFVLEHAAPPQHKHDLSFSHKFSLCSLQIQSQLIVCGCDSFIELSQCCLLKGSDLKLLQTEDPAKDSAHSCGSP